MKSNGGGFCEIFLALPTSRTQRRNSFRWTTGTTSSFALLPLIVIRARVIPAQVLFFNFVLIIFDLNEHKILIELINNIENLLNNKYSFNYILGNRYKSGSNNIGMHSDDERDLLGPIVSVSLGCNRYFDIHGKYNNEKIRIDLKS